MQTSHFLNNTFWYLHIPLNFKNKCLKTTCSQNLEYLTAMDKIPDQTARFWTKGLPAPASEMGLVRGVWAFQGVCSLLVVNKLIETF